VNRIAFIILSTACYLVSDASYCKGGHEVGASLSYLDRQSVVYDEAVRSSEVIMSALYLQDFGDFWAGGEMSYLSYRSSLSDTSGILFGAPFKYWIKGPESKGVGFYVIGTPFFGKQDNANGSASLMGVKTGPGLVLFLNDMLGIDTKLYYDYRRVGSNPEITTGLLSGFSVYF